MKNILLHMIDNEDWIVNWVIPGKSSDYVRRKWEEYGEMDDLLKHLDEVEAKTRAYLSGLSEEEFSRPVKFILPSGQSFRISLEECLFQSFTEQLYHMGELIAILWQENVEPPRMEWFRNNPRNQEVSSNTRGLGQGAT